MQYAKSDSGILVELNDAGKPTENYPEQPMMSTL
jgi:hypothetical protein